jgi:hypothetical protein
MNEYHVWRTAAVAAWTLLASNAGDDALWGLRDRDD